MYRHDFSSFLEVPSPPWIGGEGGRRPVEGVLDAHLLRSHRWQVFDGERQRDNDFLSDFHRQTNPDQPERMNERQA